MKRLYLVILMTVAAVCAHAAAPNGSGTYYRNANGKKGEALKTAMCGIIYNRTEQTYTGLWTAFRTTDKRSDGKVWDMYSSKTNYTFGTDQAGSYSQEGDVYNREHSFPASWFGSNTPMYTDLNHLYPTDGYVNGRRSNYPFGETNGGTYKSYGGFSKLGACTYSGYTGTVFEPNDEYKGDFARTYFYMITCYEEKLHDWYTNYSESRPTIDGSTYPGFQLWQLNMLLAWAANDPVSEKEINRNNAVYGIQNNRNPFIDYPGLEQYIWGSKVDDAFSYDNYVEPTEYSGYAGGGGQGGGGETPTGEADVIDLAFTGASGTNYSDWSGKSGSSSSAVYAGNNAGGNNSIQLRSDKSNSGIVSTTSGGTVTKVKVTWNSNTSSGRTLNIYGKNTAYTAATDLYNSSSQGTLLGTIVCGTSTELTISDSYAYIGLRSANNAMYLDEIQITWEDNSSQTIAPTFNDLANLSVDYGSTLTLNKGTTGSENFVTDGTVTLTSSNEAVATVSGLTITPVAVGECIISVSTAATATYEAGATMFPITVNAPDGKETAAPSGGATTTLDFTTNGWGLPNSSGTTATQNYTNDQGYTITLAASTAYYYNSNGYLMLGKNGSTLTLPAFDRAVTQIDVVGNTGASPKVEQNIYVGDTEVSTATTGAEETNTYIIDASYQAAGTIYTLKVTSNRNTQIKSIIIHFATSSTIDVTLNSYGYATYCSEYPLDFSSTEDYSAWEVTGVDDTTITFAQITGSIKGGQGVLLKGEPGAPISLTSADSSTELGENLLFGTLAPTYVDEGAYFGLSGESFVKVNAGTVPAGKALLPASAVIDEEVKMLTFVFEGADGIETTLNPQLSALNLIYNVAGQKLSRPQRGVNIINGKKVIVK